MYKHTLHVLSTMPDQKSMRQHIIDRYNEFIQHDMDPNDALYVIRLMFELNPRGFERYVSSYFHKIEQYKTDVIGCLNDHGIDVEGSKVFGHKELNLAAQCKKWWYPHKPLKKDKILEFDDNAKLRRHYNDKHELYFVTTTNASKEAKRVATEHNIKIKDCRNLIKMKLEYSLDKFREDTCKRNKNGERLFTGINVTNIIQNNLNGEKRIFYPIEY